MTWEREDDVMMVLADGVARKRRGRGLIKCRDRTSWACSIDFDIMVPNCRVCWSEQVRGPEAGLVLQRPPEIRLSADRFGIVFQGRADMTMLKAWTLQPPQAQLMHSSCLMTVN